MSKVHNIQSSFTSGEISPRLLARSDLDRYQQGVKRMENAYSLPHGGATRRAGTQYVAAIRNEAKEARLIPYDASDTIAFVLVFNDSYIQFIKEKAFVETTPPTRYEIAHTYTDAELPEITYSQQGSTLFLCHQNHPPRTLIRTSDTSWALTDITFEYHALTDWDFISSYINFRVIAGTTAFDTTSSFSITTDGAGAVTAGPTLSGTGNGTISSIEVDATLDVAGTYTIACTTSTGSGTSLRQEWTITRNADGVIPVAKWYVGNYPAAVGFYEQRLFLGGTPDDPHALWASKINSISKLTFGGNDEDGFEAKVNSGKFNQIRHLVSGRQLIILTQSAEFTLTGSRTSGLSAYSLSISTQTSHGTNTATPVQVNSEVLYTQRDGKKLRAMSYDAVQESNTSPDISIIAESITSSGIKEVAYAAIPDQITWLIRNDGVLLSLTHDRGNAVTGWARHDTGATGLFENVAVIPDGLQDIPYFLVNRTIDGGTKRYIEFMDYITVTNTINNAQTDSCSVQTGTAQTVWTGLDHLEGESVAVVADGKVHPNLTVASGQITLTYAVDDVQIGIGYDTEIELLHPEPLIDRGMSTRLGKSKLQDIVLFFQDTVNCQITLQDEAGAEIRTEDILFFSFGDAMDTAITPFTGTKSKIGQGWQIQNNLVIKQTTPMPFTLIGVDMKVSYNEK